MEIWKDVIGYEGRYMVSNYGNLKQRFRYQKMLSEWTDANLYNNKGYKYITLSNGNCEFKCIGIHRLVAIAFIPNPENKPDVNHIDFNPSNNHVSNLEWVTTSENIRHSWRAPGASRKRGTGFTYKVDRSRKRKTKNGFCYGVSFCKWLEQKPWKATYYDRKEKKMIYVGCYPTQEIAATAVANYQKQTND